jgi:WD40-like Beta Propeller Repeat
MSGNLPVWIMPVVGGAPRRIGDLTANDATFSPNGTQIAIARDDGIFLSDLNGADVRRIASLPGEPWYIAWSPDGQRLRFTVKGPSANAGALWEVSADGKNLHPLFTQSSRLANQCCGRWTSDGSYFLFTTVENGSSDLWALKEPLFGFSWFHHQPVRLTSGPIPFGDALPADHDQVAFAHGGSELVDVLSVDPKTSEAKPLLPNLQALEAGFSPDGQWVYYVTVEALWRCRPDGRCCRIRAACAALSFSLTIFMIVPTGRPMANRSSSPSSMSRAPASLPKMAFIGSICRPGRPLPSPILLISTRLAGPPMATSFPPFVRILRVSNSSISHSSAGPKSLTATGFLSRCGQRTPSSSITRTF